MNLSAHVLDETFALGEGCCQEPSPLRAPVERILEAAFGHFGGTSSIERDGVKLAVSPCGVDPTRAELKMWTVCSPVPHPNDCLVPPKHVDAFHKSLLDVATDDRLIASSGALHQEIQGWEASRSDIASPAWLLAACRR